MDAAFDYEQFPTIETDRLRLREITLADDDAIFAIRGDYEVTRYNIGAPYTDLERARQLIRDMTHQYAEKQDLRWGITLKPDEPVIGMIGFNYWNRTDHRGSVGFDLARAYWRRGIMREALNVVLRFGFESMALNRIEADASVENEASINLLLSLGFHQEGRQREQYFEDGTYHDLLLFGLLKREWGR